VKRRRQRRSWKKPKRNLTVQMRSLRAKKRERLERPNGWAAKLSLAWKISAKIATQSLSHGTMTQLEKGKLDQISPISADGRSNSFKKSINCFQWIRPALSQTKKTNDGGQWIGKGSCQIWRKTAKSRLVLNMLSFILSSFSLRPDFFPANFKLV